MATQQLVIDVYARVSELDDERATSTGGQVMSGRRRVERAGHVVGEVHIDDGKSAWNPRVKRDGWDRLMERLETRATGGVCVFDLERFSRKPIEGERLIAAADRGLLVLDSEDDYDLTTANGKKQFRDHMNAAAYYSDRLSTKVKRGKEAQARRGEPILNGRPYGFEPDGITVRDSEADNLREGTQRFLDAEKQTHIIADWNRRGLRTVRDNLWTLPSFRDVLLRPRNAGFITYRGEIVAKLPGKPIISEDDWRRVVAKFASHPRGRPVSERYLATGDAVCGDCGRHLNGRPIPRKRSYPDGSVRLEYRCLRRATNRTAAGCGRTSIDLRALDDFARVFTVQVLSDPGHAGAIEAAARKRADRATELDRQISQAEQLALALSERLGRGDLPLDRYDTAVAPLDRQLAKLRAQRDALGSPDAAPVAVPLADQRTWERRWKVADTTERRRLLRSALRGRQLVISPGPSGAAMTADDVADRVSIGQ